MRSEGQTRVRIWVAGGDICTSAWGPSGALPSRRGCAPRPTATSTRRVLLSRPAWRMDLLTLLLSCGQACAVGCICCHTSAQAWQSERRVLGPSQEWWLQRQELRTAATQVHAWEPNPRHLPALRSWAQRSRLGARFTLHAEAAWTADGAVRSLPPHLKTLAWR